MRVLITGIGQANFLIQLYEKVFPWNKVIFDIININFRNEAHKEIASNLFNKRLEFKFKLTPRNLLRPIFSSIFWNFLLLEWLNGDMESYRKFKGIIFKHSYHAAYAKYLEKLEYDYIHHHFLSIDFGLYLVYLNKTKTIVSFWGSDLFRSNSQSELFFKKISLDRAVYVTTATNDMKFHIMSKYGLKYREKIRVMKFINNDDYFNYCDKTSFEEKTQIRKRLFPEVSNKRIVAFGHSAYKEDNYSYFFKNIERMNELEKSKIHFLFCLSYGADKDFLLKNVKEKMNEVGFSYTIIEDYISHERMVEYHVCVDSFIFAPDSDAFSGYLTECFYHEIPVFVGAWLPYKEFMKMGIKYHEFEDFKDIHEILVNLEKYLDQDYRGNKEIIRKNFVESNDSYNWSKLYHE